MCACKMCKHVCTNACACKNVNKQHRMTHSFATIIKEYKLTMLNKSLNTFLGFFVFLYYHYLFIWLGSGAVIDL